ncbi:MAG: serpin family protein [Terrimicrobiaceae bacterium]
MNFYRPLGLLALSVMLFPIATHATPATESTNALGVELLGSAVPPDTNALISPYSIQSALVMAYAGAAGVTKEQMAATLFYPEEGTLDSFAALRPIMAALGGKDSPITLTIADRLFGQVGYPFHPDYLALLKKEFEAPLELADFIKSPRAAEKRINAWVEEQTRDRIKNLIPGGALTEDTRLVLVNAIYLKAPWARSFSKSATADIPFYLTDGTRVEAVAMTQTESLGYLRGEGYIAVALPYENPDLQFLVLLPDKDLKSFESKITAPFLAGLKDLPRERIALTLPKFKLEPPLLSLSDTLIKLGMPSAFNDPRGSADFSGIAPRSPDDYLYISEVFHKTFIAIDEDGTEAAAATAVVMMRAMSIPADPIKLVIDRPFLFAIQHRPSGTCLFLGRVVDPGKP